MGEIGRRRRGRSFPRDIGAIIGTIVRARADSKGVAKTSRKVKQWKNIKLICTFEGCHSHRNGSSNNPNTLT